MNKRSETKDLEENELISWSEKKLEALKPYFTQILLACLLAFLAFMAITWFIAKRSEAASQQWRQLNNSSRDHQASGDSDRLRDVADLHPDGPAAYWALQMAGDYDLQTGLGQLAQDRVDGMKTIKKAKETLERVVAGKGLSEMLDQRSRFSLGYACESLGEFGEAKKHFQTLLDKYPESSFTEVTKRAIARVEDPDFSKAYAAFTDWEDAAVAPGPTSGLPDAPSLEGLDDLDVPATQPNSGGGDLEPAEMPEKKDGDEAKDSGETKPSTEIKPMDAEPTTPAAEETEGSTLKEDEKKDMEKKEMEKADDSKDESEKDSK